tara:strand:+ start:64 stop:693 length:630 start_codon:yes stop_codon:yes gene_type:complete
MNHLDNRVKFFKEYYLKNKGRIKERQKEYHLKNKKRITERTKKYYLKNKKRIRERQKKYHLKNKEYMKEYKKEYYLKNKEATKARNKKWKLENKEHTRNHERNRYQTDINFRLLKNCRGRVLRALKFNPKSARTMELIGCTIDELRQHLESKFKPWMTWKNHGLGGWDIDHISPCAKFDFTDPEQQKICFHYTNLQPLEHIANIKKGVK